ncbi:hypothetical protein BBP40_002240 [Aspergillus hancockii]|nr:hypothetical protein BBP40_002240 [Aspergillus hancockii]
MRWDTASFVTNQVLNLVVISKKRDRNAMLKIHSLKRPAASFERLCASLNGTDKDTMGWLLDGGSLAEMGDELGKLDASGAGSLLRNQFGYQTYA